MSQCPACSSEIQDAFGLVECPNCHKVLFADFDGTLKIHDESTSHSENAEDIPTHELSEEANDVDFNTNWNLISEAPAPSLDALDPAVDADESVQANDAGFSDIIENVEPEEELLADKKDLNAIDEINQFASSQESSLQKGSLIYNLTIKNIDTEDLKEEIMEVLKEDKLGIDTKKLKFSLPTLELKDLNPVKVSVIVSRIKHLPIDLEWTQRSVITNEESEL